MLKVVLKVKMWKEKSAVKLPYYIYVIDNFRNFNLKGIFGQKKRNKKGNVERHGLTLEHKCINFLHGKK
jgi:hypothetical protein